MSDIADKFARNLQGTRIEENTARIIETTMTMDQLDSLEELYGLLRAG